VIKSNIIHVIKSNIIHVIKSRRIRLVGHVTHSGETGVACMVLVGDPWKNLVVDGWINIKVDLEETVYKSMD